jgi:hypothetical protein
MLLSQNKIAKKIANNNIKHSIRQRGMSADIYYPKQYQSIRAGYDESILYSDEEPNFSQKILVSGLMGQKFNFIGFVDNYDSNDYKMFISSNEKIPKNSLIICKQPNGKILNFKVDKVPEVGEDETIDILRYYVLVPANILRKNKNEEEFDNVVDEVIEHKEEGKFLEPDITKESTDVPPATKIKEEIKIPSRRRVTRRVY